MGFARFCTPRRRFWTPAGAVVFFDGGCVASGAAKPKVLTVPANASTCLARTSKTVTAAACGATPRAGGKFLAPREVEVEDAAGGRGAEVEDEVILGQTGASRRMASIWRSLGVGRLFSATTRVARGEALDAGERTEAATSFAAQGRTAAPDVNAQGETVDAGVLQHPASGAVNGGAHRIFADGFYSINRKPHQAWLHFVSTLREWAYGRRLSSIGYRLTLQEAFGYQFLWLVYFSLFVALVVGALSLRLWIWEKTDETARIQARALRQHAESAFAERRGPPGHHSEAEEGSAPEEDHRVGYYIQVHPKRKTVAGCAVVFLTFLFWFAIVAFYWFHLEKRLQVRRLLQENVTILQDEIVAKMDAALADLSIQVDLLPSDVHELHHADNKKNLYVDDAEPALDEALHLWATSRGRRQICLLAATYPGNGDIVDGDIITARRRLTSFGSVFRLARIGDKERCADHHFPPTRDPDHHFFQTAKPVSVQVTEKTQEEKLCLLTLLSKVDGVLSQAPFGLGTGNAGVVLQAMGEAKILVEGGDEGKRNNLLCAVSGEGLGFGTAAELAQNERQARTGTGRFLELAKSPEVAVDAPGPARAAAANTTTFPRHDRTSSFFARRETKSPPARALSGNPRREDGENPDEEDTDPLEQNGHGLRSQSRALYAARRPRLAEITLVNLNLIRRARNARIVAKLLDQLQEEHEALFYLRLAYAVFLLLLLVLKLACFVPDRRYASRISYIAWSVYVKLDCAFVLYAAFEFGVFLCDRERFLRTVRISCIDEAYGLLLLKIFELASQYLLYNADAGFRMLVVLFASTKSLWLGGNMLFLAGWVLVACVYYLSGTGATSTWGSSTSTNANNHDGHAEEYSAIPSTLHLLRGADVFDADTASYHQTRFGSLPGCMYEAFLNFQGEFVVNAEHDTFCGRLGLFLSGTLGLVVVALPCSVFASGLESTMQETALGPEGDGAGVVTHGDQFAAQIADIVEDAQISQTVRDLVIQGTKIVARDEDQDENRVKSGSAPEGLTPQQALFGEQRLPWLSLLVLKRPINLCLEIAAVLSIAGFFVYDRVLALQLHHTDLGRHGGVAPVHFVSEETSAHLSAAERFFLPEERVPRSQKYFHARSVGESNLCIHNCGRNYLLEEYGVVLHVLLALELVWTAVFFGYWVLRVVENNRGSAFLKRLKLEYKRILREVDFTTEINSAEQEQDPAGSAATRLGSAAFGQGQGLGAFLFSCAGLYYFVCFAFPLAFFVDFGVKARDTTGGAKQGIARWNPDFSLPASVGSRSFFFLYGLGSILRCFVFENRLGIFAKLRKFLAGPLSQVYRYFLTYSFVIWIISASAWTVFEASNPNTEMREHVFGSVGRSLWVTLLTLNGESPWGDLNPASRGFHCFLFMWATVLFGVPAGLFTAAYQSYITQVYFAGEKGLEDAEEEGGGNNNPNLSAGEEAKTSVAGGENRRSSGGAAVSSSSRGGSEYFRGGPLSLVELPSKLYQEESNPSPDASDLRRSTQSRRSGTARRSSSSIFAPTTPYTTTEESVEVDDESIDPDFVDVVVPRRGMEVLYRGLWRPVTTGGWRWYAWLAGGFVGLSVLCTALHTAHAFGAAAWSGELQRQMDFLRTAGSSSTTPASPSSFLAERERTSQQSGDIGRSSAAAEAFYAGRDTVRLAMALRPREEDEWDSSRPIENVADEHDHEHDHLHSTASAARMFFRLEKRSGGYGFRFTGAYDSQVHAAHFAAGSTQDAKVRMREDASRIPSFFRTLRVRRNVPLLNEAVIRNLSDDEELFVRCRRAPVPELVSTDDFDGPEAESGQAQRGGKINEGDDDRPDYWLPDEREAFDEPGGWAGGGGVFLPLLLDEKPGCPVTTESLEGVCANAGMQLQRVSNLRKAPDDGRQEASGAKTLPASPPAREMRHAIEAGRRLLLPAMNSRSEFATGAAAFVVEVESVSWASRHAVRDRFISAVVAAAGQKGFRFPASFTTARDCGFGRLRAEVGGNSTEGTTVKEFLQSVHASDVHVLAIFPAKGETSRTRDGVERHPLNLRLVLTVRHPAFTTHPPLAGVVKAAAEIFAKGQGVPASLVVSGRAGPGVVYWHPINMGDTDAAALRRRAFAVRRDVESEDVLSVVATRGQALAALRESLQAREWFSVFGVSVLSTAGRPSRTALAAGRKSKTLSSDETAAPTSFLGRVELGERSAQQEMRTTSRVFEKITDHQATTTSGDTIGPPTSFLSPTAVPLAVAVLDAVCFAFFVADFILHVLSTRACAYAFSVAGLLQLLSLLGYAAVIFFTWLPGDASSELFSLFLRKNQRESPLTFNFITNPTTPSPSKKFAETSLKTPHAVYRFFVCVALVARLLVVGILDRVAPSIRLIVRISIKYGGEFLKVMYAFFCLWLLAAYLLHVFELDSARLAVEEDGGQWNSRYYSLANAMQFTLIHLAGDFPLTEYSLSSQVLHGALFLLMTALLAAPTGLIAAVICRELRIGKRVGRLSEGRLAAIKLQRAWRRSRGVSMGHRSSRQRGEGSGAGGSSSSTATDGLTGEDDGATTGLLAPRSSSSRSGGGSSRRSSSRRSSFVSEDGWALRLVASTPKHLSAAGVFFQRFSMAAHLFSFVNGLFCSCSVGFLLVGEEGSAASTAFATTLLSIEVCLQLFYVFEYATTLAAARENKQVHYSLWREFTSLQTMLDLATIVCFWQRFCVYFFCLTSTELGKNPAYRLPSAVFSGQADAVPGGRARALLADHLLHVSLAVHVAHFVNLWFVSHNLRKVVRWKFVDSSSGGDFLALAQGAGVLVLFVWVFCAGLWWFFEGTAGDAFFASIPTAMVSTACFLVGDWAVADFGYGGTLLCMFHCLVGVVIFGIVIGAVTDSLQECLEYLVAYGARTDWSRTRQYYLDAELHKKEKQIGREMRRRSDKLEELRRTSVSVD